MKYFLPLVLLILSGCSSIRQTPGVFKVEIQKDWVKSTLAQPNLEYRKNNGMESLIVGQNIIQGNGVDGIVSLSAKNGSLNWRFNVKGGVEGGAAIVKDRLFFGGNDGQFYSIKASNGEFVWSFPTRTETISRPTVEDGVVYFLAGNNIFYALDAATGQQLWIYSRVDNQAISVRGGSQPLIHKNQVIAGFSDGYLVSLELKSGKVNWEKLLNKNPKYKDVDTQPTLSEGTLFVLAYDYSLFAVRASDGEILWKVNPGGVGSIEVFENWIFYSASNGEVKALDRETGAHRWTYKIKEGIGSSPRVIQGKYLTFMESSGSLRLLSLNSGKELTHFNTGRGSISRPVFDEQNSRMYFITNESNLYSFHIYESDSNEGIPWLN